MKKTYKKPRVKKSYKGQEIHPVYIKYNKDNPLPDPYLRMTSQEVRKDLAERKVKYFLFGIPDSIADDNDPRLKAAFQKIFDTDLHDLQKRYPGFSKELLISNLKSDFKEIALNKDDPRNQIRAVRFLKFLDEQELSIVEPDPKIQNRYSMFSVKSIIMAYYYMYKADIHPIPDLKMVDVIMTNIYKELNGRYGFSAVSFKNDWNPIFGKSGHENRTRSTQIPNIEKAIDFMELDFSAHPEIFKAIELARKELKEADLNS